MASYRSYVICTSPRSGSTLLCKLLAATGKSGNPGSHFHSPSVSDWLSSFQLPADHFATECDALNSIFNAARKRGTGDTGMFGLRLQRKSFNFLMQQMDILHPGFLSDFERLQAAFGDTLFIHLTRRNKLEQAISLVKATQTGLWHMAPDGAEIERLSAPKEPIYNAVEIAQHLAELTALDEEWKTWFAREKIDPMCVIYEDLSADPSEVLAQITSQLGLDRKIARGISPTVAKLSDATSRIWAERFLAESRGHSGPEL